MAIQTILAMPLKRHDKHQHTGDGKGQRGEQDPRACLAGQSLGVLNQLTDDEVGRHDEHRGDQLQRSSKAKIKLEDIGEVVLQDAGEDARGKQCAEGADKIAQSISGILTSSLVIRDFVSGEDQKLDFEVDMIESHSFFVYIKQFVYAMPLRLCRNGIFPAAKHFSSLSAARRCIRCRRAPPRSSSSRRPRSSMQPLITP